MTSQVTSGAEITIKLYTFQKHFKNITKTFQEHFKTCPTHYCKNIRGAAPAAQGPGTFQEHFSDVTDVSITKYYFSFLICNPQTFQHTSAET